MMLKQNMFDLNSFGNTDEFMLQDTKTLMVKKELIYNSLAFELICYTDLYKQIDTVFYLNEDLYTNITKNNLNKISRTFLNSLSLEQEFYFKKLLGIIFSEDKTAITSIIKYKWPIYIKNIETIDSFLFETELVRIMNKIPDYLIHLMCPDKTSNPISIMFVIYLYLCHANNKSFIETTTSSHMLMHLEDKINSLFIKSSKNNIKEEDEDLLESADDAVNTLLDYLNIYNIFQRKKTEVIQKNMLENIDENFKNKKVNPTETDFNINENEIMELVCEEENYSKSCIDDVYQIGEVLNDVEHLYHSISDYFSEQGYLIKIPEIDIEVLINNYKSIFLPYIKNTEDEDINVQKLFLYISTVNIISTIINQNIINKRQAFKILDDIQTKKVKSLNRNYKKVTIENEKLKEKNNILNEKYKKLQLNNKRLTESKILKNQKKEYEKQIIELNNRIKELENQIKNNTNDEEINKLREYIFNLQNENIEEKNEIKNNKIIDYKNKINELLNSNNKAKVLIAGGRSNWQQNLKENFLNSKCFTFLSVDNINFDVSIFNDISYVFFNTDYNSHGLYYKIINEVKKKGIKFNYINSNNSGLVLKQIYESLLK